MVKADTTAVILQARQTLKDKATLAELLGCYSVIRHFAFHSHKDRKERLLLRFWGLSFDPNPLDCCFRVCCHNRSSAVVEQFFVKVQWSLIRGQSSIVNTDYRGCMDWLPLALKFCFYFYGSHSVVASVPPLIRAWWGLRGLKEICILQKLCGWLLVSVINVNLVAPLLKFWLPIWWYECKIMYIDCYCTIPLLHLSSLLKWGWSA